MTSKRFKSRTLAPTCYHCGEEMYAGRSWKSIRQCKHRSVRSRIEKHKQRWCRHPRGICGEIIKVSKTTQQVWNKVNSAKTRPALIRHGQKFLKSLNVDLWKEYQNNPTSWLRTINANGEVQKHRGGMTSIPMMELRKHNKYIKGQYSRHLIADVHKIWLSSEKDITDIKETMLHEIQHWLDSMINLKANHDKFFFQRLDWLKRKFKIKKKMCV